MSAIYHNSVGRFSVQLLVRRWKREMKDLFFQTFTKAIVLVLIWQFSTGVIYTVWLVPSSLLQLQHVRSSISITATVSFISLLSPLAGYLADVKFGRFKVLVHSTHVMIASMVLLVPGLLLFAVHTHHNYIFRFAMFLFVLAMLLYCFGIVMFLANFIQFGTDQLCDAPTKCSVLFLSAYFWCDNLSNVITLGSYIPGHETFLIFSKRLIKLDSVRSFFTLAMLVVSILSSIIIACILRKKPHWLLVEKIKGNPYKLVSNVFFVCNEAQKTNQKKCIYILRKRNSFQNRLWKEEVWWTLHH